MTSKLVVNTIEADTGISSVSFASSISMNSTAKFHFSAAGVDIGADTNINRPAAGVIGFNINSSEKVRITSGGSLLVGKTVGTMATAGTRIDPQSTLITGSSTSTNLATASGAALTLINNSATDNNFSNIGGYNSNSLVTSQINFVNTSHSSRTGDITFMTHNGSSMSERLRITSDGNIGINVTPTNYSNYVTLALNDTTGSTIEGRVGGTLTGSFSVDSVVTVNAVTSIPILFKTANTERLRIDSTGQMGLGVSPSRQLDIKEASGNRVVNVRSGGSSGAFLAFLDANTTDDSKCRIGSIGGNNIGIRGDSHSLQDGGGNNRMVISSAGDVSINDGNLIVASGHGIDFSATGDAGGMSSELLDDYEEGTWTPAAYGFTISATYSARYTKIGRLVHINCYVQAAAGSGVSQQPQISGLPFTSVSGNSYSYGAGRIGTGGFNNSSVDIAFQQQSNTTVVKFYVGGGGINESMMSGQHVIFSMVYEAA